MKPPHCLTKSVPRVARLLSGIGRNVGLALLCSIAACRTAKPAARVGPIYYAGTPEYAAQQKTFEIRYEDARARVAKFIRAQNPQAPDAADVPVGLHMLIIGESYQFYQPAKSLRIPLTGYYVNGHTGAVEFRRVHGRAPAPSVSHRPPQP